LNVASKPALARCNGFDEYHAAARLGAVVTIEKSNNPSEFFDFERAGWGASIAGYDDAFGAVSRQTVAPTLDAAGVRAGMRVLDVCCGPGMLAEGVIARGAHAVGLDFSDVVKVAGKLVPAAEFRQGDAQNLPFPDGSFDAVVCGYGLMHLPDAEKALQEMRRVVRRGGRVAASVWERTTPHNGFGLVYSAVRAHGNLNVPLPHGADFFQFGTEEKMHAALSAIGLRDVRTRFLPQDWHVQSADQIMHAVLTGAVRSRALLAAQSESETKAIRGFFEQTLRGLPRAGAYYKVPLPAIIGSAAKP
jgi:SAM-dependent methyltransferase